MKRLEKFLSYKIHDDPGVVELAETLEFVYSNPEKRLWMALINLMRTISCESKSLESKSDLYFTLPFPVQITSKSSIWRLRNFYLIYQIRNIINNKVYIGSTRCLWVRICAHFGKLKSGKHHSIHLQRAWNLYGEENFVVELLEVVLPNNITEREQYYLDNNSPEYNICRVANSCTGRTMSEEAKIKIGLASIGRVCSPERRRKIGDVHKGKIVSVEARAKMSLSKIGRVVSDETKRKISIFNKGKVLSEETKDKMRATRILNRKLIDGKV